VEWVETTGKTIDEAKDAALDRLGIDHDEAEFQVLEEPKAGLFGRVRGEARVRARVAPRVPRPKQERRERRRGGKERAPAGRSTRKAAPTADAAADGVAEPDAEAETAPAASVRRRGKAAAGTSGTAKASAAAKGAAGEETSAASDGPDAAGDSPLETAGALATAIDAPADDTPAPRAGRSRGRRPGGGAAGTDRSKHADGTTAAATNGSVGATEEGPDVTVTLDEQTALAEQFLSGLLDAFGLEGQLETSRVDESTSEIDITGDDLGLLIGPRGQTIVAIQELTRIVLQRHAEGSYEGRVRIDVSGYRQRRREALARFTEQVADQVRASGTRKALEPMNAADRKVVHDTANELAGVHTVSEGEEPRRWVVIVPND
jgi:spoIIIJ-associated protein